MSDDNEARPAPSVTFPGTGTTDEASNSTCTACSTGYHTSSAGGTAISNCNLCAAGYSGDITDGVEGCTICAGGTFTTTAGQALCTACPSEKYQSNTGATSCVSCPYGYDSYNTVSDFSSIAACNTCAAGYIHSDPETEVVATSGSTVSGCTECSIGKYKTNKSDDRTHLCIDYPLGRYSDTIGLYTECTACPLGTVTESKGTSSLAGCLSPTGQPTSRPTMVPSGQPTSVPSTQPSSQPSSRPTSQPSSRPSMVPSGQPTTVPSTQPSSQPTSQPSSQPSGMPSSWVLEVFKQWTISAPLCYLLRLRGIVSHCKSRCI